MVFFLRMKNQTRRSDHAFGSGMNILMHAAIDSTNEASVRLHARFGFETVGHFKRVGYKFDRWLDVVYMELLLPEPDVRGR